MSTTATDTIVVESTIARAWAQFADTRLKPTSVLNATADAPNPNPPRRCRRALCSSDQPRKPIEQEEDRQPGHHDEVPIHRVVIDVAEAAFHVAVLGEHQCGQHESVDRIRPDMKRVKTKQQPDNRTIGIRVPGDVERTEFEYADDQRQEAEKVT